MSNLAYLLVAIALSIVGTAVLYYRHHRPKSVEDGIEDFHRELRALSPRRRDDGGPRA